MTVLITMAGLGSRFTNEGYSIPKYKIIANGRTLFEWSMMSLSEFYDQQFIFATLEDVDSEWLINTANNIGISRIKISPRKSVSLGQAETAYDALIKINNTDPLWIYNIDTFVKVGMKPSDIEGFNGCVYVFNSIDPGMSFVKFDEYGNVISLAEKKVISNWATVGMYGFDSVDTFKSVYEYGYLNSRKYEVNGERYIATLYELMLINNKSISAPKIINESIYLLGTPSQIQQFDSHAVPPIGNVRIYGDSI